MKKVKKDSPEYWNLHYKQYSFKVLANSMYGIMGASFSRYFKRELAEGITLTGQHLIKDLWVWMQREGHVPIYGDTDSIFVKLKKGSDEEDVSKEADKKLDKEIKRFGVKENFLHFSFEKTYTKFISVAKKKYSGVAADGSEKTMGLELKRREVLPKAEEWQRDLLKMLLKESHTEADFIIWAREKQKFVHDGKLTQADITYQKKLSREIEDYGKVSRKTGRQTPTPAHVKVAMRL